MWGVLRVQGEGEKSRYPLQVGGNHGSEDALSEQRRNQILASQDNWTHRAKGSDVGRLGPLRFYYGLCAFAVRARGEWRVIPKECLGTRLGRQTEPVHVEHCGDVVFRAVCGGRGGIEVRERRDRVKLSLLVKVRNQERP